MSRIIYINQTQDLANPGLRQQRYLQELHRLNSEQASLLMDIREPEKAKPPIGRSEHGVRKIAKWLMLEVKVCRERSV